MSYFLRVFCRSDRPVTRREIAEFIATGSYFDRAPLFDPTPDSPQAGEASWATLAIYYDARKRPVRIERNLNDALLREEVEELLFVIAKSKDAPAKQEVEKTLRSALQVFSLEVNRETISEDGWEMLDSVQSFLAERCDGIVYAPDDGFFDKKLRPLYRL